ncbi:S41 family peptidase [Streptomyces sp. NPDC057702]|uniref:S41 family peptidase n=1 Tax=unclassified Streptomyces TaxID=2593676 RepID=UPI00367549AE
MNRPLRSAPAGRQLADAEPRPRRTHRGAALGLVFASVLATGAATGSWDQESSANSAPPGHRAPADPAADPRPGTGPRGAATPPAPSAPGYDAATRDVSRGGDRWSSVYTRREYEGFQHGLEGRYVGVGLWARRTPDGAIAVDRVQPGSPAARAGVRAGDRLRSIDGVPVTGRPVTEVVARLRGDLAHDEHPAADPAPRGAAAPPRAPAADHAPEPDRPATPDAAPPEDAPREPTAGQPEPGRGGEARTPDERAATTPPQDDAGDRTPGEDAAEGGEAARDEADRGGVADATRRPAGAPHPADATGGPAGSTVVLGLERAGRAWTQTLRRSRLVTENVTVGRLTDGEPDATRIKVDAFTKDTGERVREAVRAAPKGDGLVLDLRGNSGGLVTEAATAASAFLDGGLVATYDVRGDQRVVNAEPGGDTQTPLVVLVDGGTMSAGELLTGALQDRGRAVVLGSRTFGKGSVQMPTERPDGSVAEETVGHYRTPVGRGVEGVGITPDLAVEDDAEQRAQSVLSGLGGGA